MLLAGLMAGLLRMPVAQAQDTAGFPVGDLKRSENPAAEWWNLSGVAIEAAAEGVSKVTGNGRILVAARGRKFTLVAGGLKTVFNPGSMAFVDQVQNEVRLMILSGKATVTDGQRRFDLTPSMQAVLSPEPNSGYFINDGIYRRAVIQRFDNPGWSTLVRQFYLEQVVYADPMLRTLYQNDAHARRLIEALNKKAAIIRDLNGTAGYEQGQV